MPISVKMQSEKMTTIAINWSLAKCSCPSWSANTDESALRRSLASLDDCNSSLHWWLGFWTFLVALGVVLEVVFVVWEYLNELHDFRRGIIRAPERPQTALFVLGLFGAGLVAAGVSGEFWKESQIATVETCIRKGNDALFLLLSKEAGDARVSAQQAKYDAAVLGKWMEAVGGALRQPLLTPQQIKAISDDMRPLANPSLRITIITTYQAMGLASGVAKAITGAGFSDPDFDIRTSTSPEISMGSPMDREHRKVAEVLYISVLKNGHLPGMGIIAPLPEGSPVKIVVGQHLVGPIPPFPKAAPGSNPNK